MSENTQKVLESIKKEAEEQIASSASTVELAHIETEYLGRKGKVTELLRKTGELPKEDRPAWGQNVNKLKNMVGALIESRRSTVAAEEEASRLSQESIDVTLPGRFFRLGRRHPLTATIDEIKRVFIGLGFEVVEGPEVEEYKFNFDALNYPEDHPAMDAQMSFYITDDRLLRTQTTALQGRVMEHKKPPFRICTVGRCFRYDALDATHSHTFHQVDCFAVDEKINMADLKGTLSQFARELFGPASSVRFRPDYFPFVEPGVEYAITCFVCQGKGCPLCKMSGWIEIGGAGLIHPTILERFGIDSEKYTGFAFGLGIERVGMLRYGIDDIRLFLEDDLRFLRQF
ncbi:MAG: phenylalanine--tRNA ligase subunit alpha [Armatimonadota bacterium]